MIAGWAELADRVGAPPFLRPGYVTAWYDAFGEEPELITTGDEGRPTGVVPLVRRGRATESAANSWTEVWEPLAEDHEALARELFARGYPRIELLFLHKDGEAANALREEARRARYRLLERTLQCSPFIDLSGRSFDEYADTVDSKLKREVRRRRRRLEEEGELTLDVSTEPAGLDEGFAVEAAAWKEGAGTAITSVEGAERFYRAMADWAAGEGILRLVFLRLDGRPLAFDFCLEANGAHYLMKTGYDPAHRKLAPGIIMRWLMIERAFDEGLASYEFLGHDDEWKLRWTDTRRNQVMMRFFSPSPAGRLSHVSYAHARPLAKRLLRR